MRILKSPLFVIAVYLMASMATAGDAPLSDQAIRKILIEQSIQRYLGNCPCPYNRAANGSRCGKRSAWSREGGYAPLCYDTDVSDEAVASYWERIRASKPNKSKEWP